jgi:hypothetical protein
MIDETPNWTKVRRFFQLIESLPDSDWRGVRAAWHFEGTRLYHAIWRIVLRDTAAFLVRGRRRAQAKGQAWNCIRLLVQQDVVAVNDSFSIVNAAFAIIDRDRISGAHFRLLYAPFEPVIPFTSLRQDGELDGLAT